MPSGRRRGKGGGRGRGGRGKSTVTPPWATDGDAAAPSTAQKLFGGGGGSGGGAGRTAAAPAPAPPAAPGGASTASSAASLATKLSSRPSQASVADRGIVKGSRRLSANLQGAASQLQRNVTAVRVSEGLKNRQQVGELERKGVRRSSAVADSIQ